MSYEKQTFKDNETVLKAEHLQHIEDGIVQNENTINELKENSQTDISAVQYVTQSLTAEQKAIARANIGAEAIKSSEETIIGNPLLIESDSIKTATVEISSNDDGEFKVWHTGKNILPKFSSLNGLSMNGVNISVLEDGTIKLHGTTTSSSSPYHELSINMPHFYDAKTPIRMHVWYNKLPPNSSGYVLFKLIGNGKTQAVASASLINNGTFTDGGHRVFGATDENTTTIINKLYLSLYNVPEGVVFDDFQIKFMVELASTASEEYVAPDYNVKTVNVSGGVGSTSMTIKEGTNYFVTDASTMSLQTTGATEAPIQSFVGKRWACFGDSLTDKNLTYEYGYELRYFEYVAKELNLSVTNYGLATTGYGTCGNKGDGNEFFSRMAKINPDGFDFMTILGSCNDASRINQNERVLGEANDIWDEALESNTDMKDKNTVCACINHTIDVFYEKAPLKKLGIITMPPTYAWYPSKRDAETNELLNHIGNQYVEELIQICKIRSIPCLDLYHCSGLRPWVETDENNPISSDLWMFFKDETKTGVSDGVHPNSRGAAFIAPMIREFVKTLM